jgi:pimeloyl-ACP methyl ester carboxylesterase
MPFVKLPKLTIHYELAGMGENVLVLLHGNFASWRWWRPTLERLPPGCRAYAPSLRGCGDTDHPQRGYTIEQLADDLYEFATRLRLAHFHLIGHSLGGAVALQLALNHPKMAHSLLLVAPAPAEGLSIFGPNHAVTTWGERLLGDQVDPPLEAGYRMLRALGANHRLLRQALIWLTPTLLHDDWFESLVNDASDMAPEAVVGYWKSLETWNIQARLGSLHLPVMILAGEQDILIARAALERTARGIAHSHLVVWPDVGHSPHLEQPARFAQLLGSFVNHHSPTRIINPAAIGKRLGALLSRQR